MAENKRPSEPRDYKERFEFEVTIDGNIICQRYFRIPGFNPKSVGSYELTEAVRACVATIDNDLKDKSHVYMELFAPMVFETEDDMRTFVAKPENYRFLRPGHGIVVKSNTESDYASAGDGEVKVLGYKFDDGELSGRMEVPPTMYKFAFKVDGREVCSMLWEGRYPNFIREKIDLSGKAGRFEAEDISSLSFKQYLIYKINRNRRDLISEIIKRLSTACSYPDRYVSYITDKDGIIDEWKRNSEALAWRVY